MSQLDLGTPAPPLDLPTASGAHRSLREFRGKSVMVSFLGPANCLFCRAHVIRMIQAKDAIAAAGAEVVLVAYNDPELMMAKMFNALDLPFVLLVDRTREFYGRWGLGPAGIKAVLNPGLYLAMLRVVLRRERSLGSAPTARQLGGDFVVDRHGRLAFVHRMRSLHDRARIEDLVAAAQQA
jgi:peroxiredoxin